jgi:hypothetical protein
MTRLGVWSWQDLTPKPGISIFGLYSFRGKVRSALAEVPKRKENMKNNKNSVFTVIGFAVLLCTLFLLLFSLSSGDWIFSLGMSAGVTGIFIAGAWLTSRKIKL